MPGRQRHRHRTRSLTAEVPYRADAARMRVVHGQCMGNGAIYICKVGRFRSHKLRLQLGKIWTPIHAALHSTVRISGDGDRSPLNLFLCGLRSYLRRCLIIGVDDSDTTPRAVGQKVGCGSKQLVIRFAHRIISSVRCEPRSCICLFNVNTYLARVVSKILRRRWPFELILLVDSNVAICNYLSCSRTEQSC
jgi:hypothetical protein